MKKLLLIWLLLPLTAFASSEKKLRTHFPELDVQRRLAHQWANKEIKNINYLRMKILSIQKMLKEINSTWAEIAKTCNRNTSGSDLEICKGKIGEVADSSRIYLNQLEILTVAKVYQDLIVSPTVQNVAIRDLVSEAIRALNAVHTSSSELSRRIGLKVAAQSFQKEVLKIKSSDLKAKTEIQCRLLPSQLAKKVIAINLDQLDARKSGDPHLLLRSTILAEEVTATVQVMSERCSSSELNAARIQQARASQLAAKVGMDEINLLSVSACEKIGSADLEIAAQCKERNFSPAVIYSIHRKLRQMGAK